MGDKLVTIVADWETLVGWSIISFVLQTGLVQSLELENLTICCQTSQNCELVIVGDWISLQ